MESRASASPRTAAPPKPSGLGATVLKSLAVPAPPLNYYFAPVVLAILAIVLMVGFFIVEGGLRQIVGIVGLLSGITAALLYVHRKGKACRVAVYEHGVSIARKNRTSSIRFDKVDALFVREKVKMNNGRAVGMERRVELKGAFGMAVVEDFARDRDLTGPFTREVVTRVAKSTEGRPLAGEGWSVDNRGITTAAGTTMLGSIAECGEVDGKMCFWRGGESEPFLAIPSHSANAHVLWELARPHVESKPEKARETKGIGRLLWQRRGATAAVGIAVTLLLAASVYAIWVFNESWIAIALIAILTVLLVGVSYYTLSSQRLFYERGLRIRTAFGSRSLLYSDVARFTWAATRQFINGVYTGTAIHAKLVPDSGTPIRLGFSSGTSDENALELLRQQIAIAVADRLEAAFNRGERVQWSADAVFFQDHLEHRPPKMIGKAAMRKSGYKDLAFRMENGTFYLVTPDDDKPSLEIPAATENFWPGMILLERLATRE